MEKSISILTCWYGEYPWYFPYFICNFNFIPLAKGVSIFDCPNHVQSMTWLVKKAEQEGLLRPYFDFIIVEGTPSNVKWDKGKIVYKDTFEALYYNLISFKVESKRPKVYNPIPETFYFTPRKILIEN